MKRERRADHRHTTQALGSLTVRAQKFFIGVGTKPSQRAGTSEVLKKELAPVLRLSAVSKMCQWMESGSSTLIPSTTRKRRMSRGIWSSLALVCLVSKEGLGWMVGSGLEHRVRGLSPLVSVSS